MRLKQETNEDKWEKEIIETLEEYIMLDADTYTSRNLTGNDNDNRNPKLNELTHMEGSRKPMAVATTLKALAFNMEADNPHDILGMAELDGPPSQAPKSKEEQN